MKVRAGSLKDKYTWQTFRKTYQGEKDKIRNEIEDVTTGIAETQRIRDYCEQLYANKFHDLKEINS